MCCGSNCLNCNTANNAISGKCNNSGQCTTTLCAAGYHLSGAGETVKCEPNTDTCCGLSGGSCLNCNTANNANSGLCNAITNV
jgi:hypothetical protein